MSTTREIIEAVAGKAGVAVNQPGPIDSFIFAGIVWFRLETPMGNSVILGVPNAPRSVHAPRKRRAKAKP